jgi:uncharacterized sporulation protein YeaH/YhbH (DUF444 family)
MRVIDRRLNPGGKSLANRQRFLRRAKSMLRQVVRDISANRGIRDAEQGGEVAIPLDSVREPALRRASTGGMREYLLPGNKEYVEGDTIPRPPRGGGGRGSEGSPDGGGEDEFRFVLSNEEFLDLFLEDLELPDLAKRRLSETHARSWRRAGYSVTGSPANLSVMRTMRSSLSRRIALKRPKPGAIERLQEELSDLELEGGDADRLEAFRDELARQLRRSRLIPYIDPIDIRYKRFEATPKPIAQAVMFCLMDVSSSMSEHMKDLAKRFYMLLYIFLTRRYRHVEIVFVRHTDRAEEVDEETFFRSPATGGTMVSSALEAMRQIIAARYRPEDWNIYAAQASDGDNSYTDGAATEGLLTGAILPVSQYFAYLEVGDEGSGSTSDSALWTLYRRLHSEGALLSMRKVSSRSEIFPVFHELFQRRRAHERVAP